MHTPIINRGASAAACAGLVVGVTMVLVLLRRRRLRDPRHPPRVRRVAAAADRSASDHSAAAQRDDDDTFVPARGCATPATPAAESEAEDDACMSESKAAAGFRGDAAAVAASSSSGSIDTLLDVYMPPEGVQDGEPRLRCDSFAEAPSDSPCTVLADDGAGRLPLRMRRISLPEMGAVSAAVLPECASPAAQEEAHRRAAKPSKGAKPRELRHMTTLQLRTAIRATGGEVPSDAGREALVRLLSERLAGAAGGGSDRGAEVARLLRL